MARGDNEPGGDYITLTIEKNGVLVFKRECVLTELIANGTIRRYKTDDSDILTAPSGVSPVELARRLLKPRGER